LKKVIFVSLFSILGLISFLILDHKLLLSWETGTETPESKSKLNEVLSDNELRVVLDYNTTDYFIYKGEPQGFQYELLKAFCNEKNIELKVLINNDLNSSIKGLINDGYDLVAKNIISDYVKNDQVDYTVPLVMSHLMLVQRNQGKNVKSIGSGSFVRYRFDLKGKKVFVPKNSSFAQYIRVLSSELGGGITIVEDSLSSTEQLIAKVADNEIDFTVCNESSYNALKEYFTEVDFSTPLSFGQKISWAIAKKSPEWKEFLDEWIIRFKETTQYEDIYEKYYSGKSERMFKNSEYNSFIGGRLSEFDKVIKEVSAFYRWDWRLISSIVFQESNFDPNAQSIMGAIGLMQLMPNTAHVYNVDNLNEPSENIRGGVAYLTYLDEIFEPIIIDKSERIKFVLASYNIGVGHVMDARKLAAKFNKNPSLWKDNVADFLKKKSVPQYYNDPVVSYGYCRGEESLNFVSIVLDHYRHYLNILPSGDSKQLAVL
jgi:membrane-bound lytic murein transglycosylase F